MGETRIEWAHFSFNPWVGCTKVSDACSNCYAESWAKRSGHPELWTGERRRTTPAYWRQPIKWNEEARRECTRKRVFCASLADVFDNQVPKVWRSELWSLIAMTPYLDWLLLTKRPQNIKKMFYPYGAAPWHNVWLGTTTENQETFDQRWKHLAKVPAVVRFISYEPALGPLADALSEAVSVPHWLIAGGESGAKVRPPDPNWFRDVRDACYLRGIAFLFKQWGGRRPKDGGRLLDGVEHNGYPR